MVSVNSLLSDLTFHVFNEDQVELPFDGAWFRLRNTGMIVSWNQLATSSKSSKNKRERCKNNVLPDIQVSLQTRDHWLN